MGEPTRKDFLKSQAMIYAQLLPEMRTVAQEHGYALALHGSLMRDCDLIAVPWVEEASAPEVLVKALKECCGGYFHHPAHDQLWPEGPFTEKPHGRKTWSIHLTQAGGAGPYFDVSVMPRR